MTTQIKPFSPIERTALALIERDFEPVRDHPGRVGGDLPGSLSELYVRLEKVGGRSDRFEGDFILDVECFHPDYSSAENAALALEALLLGYPHVVEVNGRRVVLDEVQQNQGPSETHWDDDSVHRLLATYVITARR